MAGAISGSGAAKSQWVHLQGWARHVPRRFVQCSGHVVCRERRIADVLHGVSMTTVQNSELIDTLNDLIEICLDGEYGFRVSAEQVKSGSLRANLLNRSAECDT